MAANFTCKPCNRDFKAEEDLQKHMQTSKRHRSQRCEACSRNFAGVESLEQHIRDSPAHNNATAPTTKPTTTTTTNNTPLDRFFRSFVSFAYNPSLPPAKSHGLLRRHMGWLKDSSEGDRAKKGYQDALVDEVRIWFGNENDLASWHTLCRAIGIEEIPETIEACEKVVRKTHVNILDLIHWGRGGGGDVGVQVFESWKALRKYTLAANKIFPQRSVVNEKGETNVVLRHLLRRFFFTRGGSRKARM
ncbi:hypothetical protein B0T25DRAFT_621523 [Lasiosphaeria hispida]|uniref:C2H2-type domain-containing protein n=1 Tax=Lasiosphaeria hispida TaxID=260671 RepID=A0AAJ0HSA7_9PEZI|nr:hypothetical protein B0T25DRAFT_621523 [Lasiosphaeria hispida]